MNAAPTPAPGVGPSAIGDAEAGPSASPVLDAVSSSSTAIASTTGTASAYKSRPARRQITPQRAEQLRQEADKSTQTGVSYNIWYNKWSGGDREAPVQKKAPTRCSIARDAGYTRGDFLNATIICLPFAKGRCSNGTDCAYLHRLPPSASEASMAQAHTATNDQGRDVFGREKMGDYKDDMGGIGSIQRVNRTLYVGRIHEEEDDLRRISNGGGANTPGGPSWRDGGRTVKGGKSVGQARREGGMAHKGPFVMSNTEKVLRRHFGEWGTIERVKVLHHRGCAFVTYLSEASAQFAKAAMSNQSLDHDEILNIRWSTEDPNPGAIQREKRRMEIEGGKRVLENMTPEEWEVLKAREQLEAGEDGNKRMRIEGAGGTTAEEDEEMARLIAENQRNWEEMARQEEAAKQQQQVSQSQAAASEQQVDTAANGKTASNGSGNGAAFFSTEAIGGLAHLQALRKQQGQAASSPANKQQTAPAPAGKSKSAGLGGLAAYGSDDSDEEE
ncbi:hypothetical protein BCV69DRAFT_274026 [Microstroma glucosiphilum]|uniref:Pre-mRNA-splicing factor CWC2 n=1 Tax=Pseudomicrostroma glucosiphilum TaxID=1684307 RepID=A0A316TY77_9BASI|nr:hypothetical protein BCV69DRAFT_274026 [Pseudomicrostroma glucosiphilum]PWN18202.1 hypothetical protein BCV69DRAFT_274026 [Pseudomicrostroma glucosiphilum]